MFHGFQDSCRTNVGTICEHISRYFEPVPLATVAAAIRGEATLPPNALAVTIDDGYKNFLFYGHSVFRRYQIPTTIYAVAGFSDRRLWLWTDQIVFGLEHTCKARIGVELQGVGPLELDLSSAASKAEAAHRLQEALKLSPNECRLEFLAEFGALCGVDIPPVPPPNCAPLTWDELRALADEGVEIGCHTDSHPILSRISRLELDREIRGAKELMETRLGLRVKHFCYPNGRDIDISRAAVACVKAAGFESSVTCTYGLNTLEINPLLIRRVPFDSGIKFEYAAELLAGLHM
jgi:peptidoglycan/xylan/chitin deacetylase (PgdA/CDA1 family)